MLRDGVRSMLVGLFLLSGAPANAAGQDARAVMETAGRANAPIGQLTFCKAFPGECDRRGGQSAVGLTETRWRELTEVNEEVNRSVSPFTDVELYGEEEVWTLPVKEGDCEDYVLLKRRILMQAGWPSGTLLVTVVFDEFGEGHAVLVARTDRGDLVLDNKVDAVVLWRDTAYRYVKRQSVFDPKRWVAISDDR